MTVNGEPVVLHADPQSALIWALRADLGLLGVRPGCAIGECGACTVLCDGQPLQSCSTPLSQVAGAAVTTPEGLGDPITPHPVQRAFIAAQAAQCGYCINGIIMTVAALVDRDPRPSRQQEIRAALSHHLCRCGTHVRILAAVAAVLGVELAGAAMAPTTVAGDGPPGAHTPPATLPAAVAAHSEVSDWLRLAPDGRIEVLLGKVEIGQGIRTACAQIVAAQLGVPLSQVVMAPVVTGRSPDQRHTAGSRSIEEGGTALAMAAVALRRLLFARAAQRLGISADHLRLQDAQVVTTDGRRAIALVDLAGEEPVTGAITLADRPHWDAVALGASVARDDLPAKVAGGAAYLHDLQLPDMLHARVLLPPSYDAQLLAVELGAARASPGVRCVVHDGRLLIVIAEREDQAVRAVARLERSARWQDPGLTVDDAGAPFLRTLPAVSTVTRDDAATDAALAGGSHRLQATYTRPYQAHGAMAPSCAVALNDGDLLTVETSSQGIYPLRRELATLLARDEARIVVRYNDGPGCYGHNGADDAAALAAIAAQAVPGHAVRLQFSGSDEFTWEPYGPAMLADLEASLDAAGRIVGWRHRTRTDTHTARPDGAGDRLLAAWLRADAAPRQWVGPTEAGTRNVVPLYDLPAVSAVTDFVRGPLRTGSLRALASHLNVFAIESFVDELAAAVGEDPLAFRLEHLRDTRARRVLEVAARAAGWTPHASPSGRGQGLAVARYDATKAYVAQAVEATIDVDTGEIVVERVVVACDAGTIINRDGLVNQLEGGVIQGLSRALFEEVRVDRRGIRSRDWTTYPVLRFAQVPQVQVILVDQAGHPPLGAGEAATPPLAPALANAIDDAVGIRLRDLPFTAERTRRRLLEMSDDELARVLLT